MLTIDATINRLYLNMILKFNFPCGLRRGNFYAKHLFVFKYCDIIRV